MQLEVVLTLPRQENKCAWLGIAAVIFQNIGPDGTRLTELAARAMVSKQNASVLVDQLERHR